jgi:hypothetical protein
VVSLTPRTASLPEKEPPVPFEPEADWAPEPVWALGRRGESLASAGNRTAIRRFQLSELIEVLIDVGIFLCLNSLCFAYRFETANRWRLFRHTRASSLFLFGVSAYWKLRRWPNMLRDYFNKNVMNCFDVQNSRMCVCVCVCVVRERASIQGFEQADLFSRNMVWTFATGRHPNIVLFSLSVLTVTCEFVRWESHYHHLIYDPEVVCGKWSSNKPPILVLGKKLWAWRPCEIFVYPMASDEPVELGTWNLTS